MFILASYNQLLRFIVIAFCGVILSACASKPPVHSNVKPMGYYTIVSVDVHPDQATDQNIATQLQHALQQSVGRLDPSQGRKARLSVRILPYEPFNADLLHMVRSFGGRKITIIAQAIDPETNALLTSSSLSATSTSDDMAISADVIVAKLVRDIRAIIGVSTSQPYPVKPYEMIEYRAGASDVENMQPMNLLNETKFARPTASPRQVDPLLNGEINANTTVEDLLKRTNKFSEDVKQAEELIMKKSAQMQDTNDDDGICVVTVENDCLATGRQ